MTKWTHHGRECDGAWSKTYDSFQSACDSLRDYALTSPDEPIIANYRYYSDIGGVHYVAEWDGLEDYGEAYDARECDMATPEQLALLARIEGTE